VELRDRFFSFIHSVSSPFFGFGAFDNWNYATGAAVLHNTQKERGFPYNITDSYVKSSPVSGNTALFFIFLETLLQS
jgi:hypothetical protein